MKRRMSGLRPRGQDSEWWWTGWPNPCLDGTMCGIGIREDGALGVLVAVSPRCRPPTPRPFIKDQIQVSSLSNLRATSLVSVTSPVLTPRGSPRIIFIRLPGQIGPWHWTNGRWWCGMASMSSGLLLFPGSLEE